ncbi:MAG TPA: DMP19 family protein [Terriglobia bacterium]|nr:DMP19 family protein [Terriglobia bacterium]
MDPKQITTLVENLEAEVNNGGFDQFFYNSTGDNTEEAIQALEAIGASSMAEILRRAAGKFPDGMPPKDRVARQDLLLQISPDGHAFEDLDSQFCGYPDDLSGLLAKYVSS